MKKYLLLIAYLGLSNYCIGQTNTFPASGNVGIGTTSPGSALSIVKSGLNHLVDYASIQISTSASGNTYGPILYLNGTATTGGKQWGLVSSGPLDAAATGTTGNFAIYDTSAGSRLVINSFGNVGIGTLNPSEKLAVNGKIRAQEIKVENANWPDFVFAKSYALPTLSEIEKHIKEKGHLQGIPSAAEVKANGVDLGEMNAKLLQKIEELTLHLIRQEKEIAELKQKNN